MQPAYLVEQLAGTRKNQLPIAFRSRW